MSWAVYLLPSSSADVKTKFGLANTLTALRLLLVVPSVWAIAAEQYVVAAIVFCCAVVTDLADGRVARARGEVSVLGGLFDHSVDAGFVALSLAALAFSGASSTLHVTPALPVLVALSFSQYVLDSKVLAGRALRASALGRYNGIGYFVVLGTAVIGAAIGLPGAFHQKLLSAMAWGLVMTTLLSMLDRFVAYQKVRDLP